VSELATPEQALEQAALAGVHCFAISTPFAVGKVNCYLIEDEPLTLIDTGPNSGRGLDEMTARLAERGYALEDLERIVLTHLHIDHIGLVEILVEHSGAEVAALGAAADRLSTFEDDTEKEDEFAVGIMLRNGIPEDVTVALRSVSRSFRGWGSRADVTQPLEDGGELGFANRSLQVLHRPGHSPADTVFWDAKRNILIVGDHLIAHISSNPLITRPLDGSEKRTKTLVTYIDSLSRTREMPAEMLLSGHGEPILDHVELIDSRLAGYSRRKEKIYRLIDERPRTGYEIAQAIWGNVAVTQAFLTLSEVIGHADLLVDEGRVREVDDGNVLRYETTG
jgi:glyoxylase-like metal-dependent hydrolase (beta-lactamase superfamily II)